MSIDEFLRLDDNVFDLLLTSMQYEKDPILIKLIKAFNKPNDEYLIAPFDHQLYKQYFSKLNQQKYLVDVVKTKNIDLYNAQKQPILIYDELMNQTNELSKVSNIINKLALDSSKLNKINKFLIIKKDILK